MLLTQLLYSFPYPYICFSLLNPPEASCGSITSRLNFLLPFSLYLINVPCQTHRTKAWETKQTIKQNRTAVNQSPPLWPKSSACRNAKLFYFLLKEKKREAISFQLSLLTSWLSSASLAVPETLPSLISVSLALYLWLVSGSLPRSARAAFARSQPHLPALLPPLSLLWEPDPLSLHLAPGLTLTSHRCLCCEREWER